ncbi:FecR family protein [Aquimarina hainanensis]|uniref:FecR family protein n=1 Tax=Aquimarina hainanensis TaxID=1578017 RepID=A0ABW5NFU7_9FLAO
MDNFYEILSKHFLKETTAAEEAQVSLFIEQNKTEYLMLKRLWDLEGAEVNIIDFDTETALDKIEKAVQARKKETPKVIPLYTYLRRIAAILVVLFMVTAAGYYLYSDMTEENIVIAENTNSSKGKEVILADGTKVWLNKNATLQYPNRFSSNIRNVELKGEAFFDVAENKEKPFVITMNDSEVTVLGTSFNIKNDSTETKVTVATGKVGVKASHINASVVVTPGYTAFLNAHELVAYENRDKNFMSWKTGIFEFNNTPLTEVITYLNQYYEKQISVVDETSIDCNLSTKFSKIALSEVIEILRITCGIQIIEEKESYKIE